MSAAANPFHKLPGRSFDEDHQVLELNRLDSALHDIPKRPICTLNPRFIVNIPFVKSTTGREATLNVAVSVRLVSILRILDRLGIDSSRGAKLRLRLVSRRLSRVRVGNEGRVVNLVVRSIHRNILLTSAASATLR